MLRQGDRYIEVYIYNCMILLVQSNWTFFLVPIALSHWGVEYIEVGVCMYEYRE